MVNRRTVTAPPGGQSIAFTREVEAPAARVFAAHTEIETLARWTGPRGTTVEVRAFDARAGGLWSYVVRGRDGVGWAFFGSFHEVSAPHRLVQTFEFEGDPGHPTFETLTFTDLPGGRCRVDGLSLFGSVSERDAMLDGMDSGMDVNYERLDELLAAERELG